jgi:CDP-diglyceride synthetase
MTAAAITALYLTVPIIVSGVGHMVVVRGDLLPSLKRPIGEVLFGPNKTWRGAVVMPVLTVPGVFLGRMLDGPLEPHLLVSLHDAPAVVLGVALGLGYILAELPNSWWKRRQGIAAGQLPERGRIAYILVDQADSAVGCGLVYVLLLAPPPSVLIVLVLVGPSMHLVANVVLYLVGLRKRPV